VEQNINRGEKGFPFISIKHDSMSVTNNYNQFPLCVFSIVTTEYRIRVHFKHLFCNALIHVIYSEVSAQCSHTILLIILG